MSRRNPPCHRFRLDCFTGLWTPQRISATCEKTRTSRSEIHAENSPCLAQTVSDQSNGSNSWLLGSKSSVSPGSVNMLLLFRIVTLRYSMSRRPGKIHFHLAIKMAAVTQQSHHPVPELRTVWGHESSFVQAAHDTRPYLNQYDLELTQSGIFLESDSTNYETNCVIYCFQDFETSGQKAWNYSKGVSTAACLQWWIWHRDQKVRDPC
jgi:hypothetical protein